MSDKILVSKDDLQYLEACEFTLHQFYNVAGLCPNCKKAMLINGLLCPNCNYDNSYTLEEWKILQKE